MLPSVIFWLAMYHKKQKKKRRKKGGGGGGTRHEYTRDFPLPTLGPHVC
jgi:hypothetical protein